jgi:ATP-dependent protease Clp ATPase subunit
MREPKREVLRCSFCRKSQDEVSKLISSPSDYPRAYICDECIQVCKSILEDVGAPPSVPADREGLACHPMAPQLLDNVEQWILAESEGRDPAQFVDLTRQMARAMMGLDPA